MAGYRMAARAAKKSAIVLVRKDGVDNEEAPPL